MIWVTDSHVLVCDSVSLESLLPNLDIENLKDPVEFFKAHERMESKLSLFVVALPDSGLHGLFLIF